MYVVPGHSPRENRAKEGIRRDYSFLVGKCLAMFRTAAKASGQENGVSFPLEESAGLMLARES